MGINKSSIDLVFGITGTVMLFIVFVLLVFYKRAQKITSIRLYIGFSLFVSFLLLMAFLKGDYHEYSRIYFIVQNFSYFLEIVMCIEITEMITKNNLVVLMIFGPILLMMITAFIIKYSSPSKLTEFIYPGFAASTMCGFLLFIIWQFESKFNYKLIKPYSGIAFCIGLFVTLRFAIMLTNQYYQQRNWNIIGRLYPINELIFMGLLLRALLFSFPEEHNSHNST